MSSTFNKLSLSIAFAVANVAVINTANAHGWADFPPSRTEICDRDGGYWQNAIPNAACQALWDKSNAHPFTQKHENAALTSDYNNMAAVKRQVPDGLLCAAGDKKKAGLDIPHTEWQETALVLDENGEFDFEWTAPATHNPSFWEFYLTKPDHDFTQSLVWDDLVLVDTAANVAPRQDGKRKYYQFKVKLPTDRTGKAILYTRWQRIDPAGEGFYNCSDITIQQQGGSVDVTPPNTGSLQSLLGFFVQPGFEPAVGDTVRFRIMAPMTGAEVVDQRLVVTAQNQANWAQTLASNVNAIDAAQWAIGEWNSTTNQYEFNNANIYANQVWAPESDYAFALSLFEAVEPVPPIVEPEPPIVEPEPVVPADGWKKSATYLAGDEVKHAGKTWKAAWWTQGDEPGKSGVWKQVVGEGEAPAINAWSADNVYNVNDVVIHKGENWQANWYTKGEEPGTTGQWGVWRKL